MESRLKHDNRAGDARSRILAAAAGLVATGGGDAATTRAVALAAAVQAPTIYRLFGDKEGLLDAVAEHTLAAYVAGKAERSVDDDPVEDLRLGWEAHVAFGLANPAVFSLMSAPRDGGVSPAALAGMSVLRERVRRIALTGRLRIPEERAVDLVHAIGTGTVLSLLQKPVDERTSLSEAAWEAVRSEIVGDPRPAREVGAAGAASALRASLEDISGITAGERHLLSELLDRIAQSGGKRHPVG